MFERRWVNILFFVLGSACQAVAAFEVPWVAKVRAGILVFAAALFTVARIDRAITKGTAAVAVHLLAALSLVATTACSIWQPVKGCAQIVAVDEAATFMTRVRRILANPSRDQVLAELNAMVIERGKDFVRCLVQRVGSEAEHTMQASPGIESTEDRLVEENAKWWLAQ